MKTSVIIPVYNVFDYLEKCINSVTRLNADIEILLVDDGSIDGSSNLCDKIAETDSRIKVIHQENGGLSAARNTGIKHSTGDYLLFIDSDDFIETTETEKILNELDGETEVYMGLYRCYYSLEDKFEEENCEAFLKLHGKTDINSFLDVVPKNGQSCYMTAWRFIVKKEFVLENKLFFFEGIYHEDEEWTHRLFCCCKSVFVSHYFFYNYRQNREGAITATIKPKHLLDSILIIERANSLSATLEANTVKFIYLRQRMSNKYLDIMINLYSVPKEQRNEIFKKLLSLYDDCKKKNNR